MKIWNKIGKSILNLFLRSNCPLCDRPADGDVLCSFCEKSLRRLQFKNPRQWWTPQQQCSGQLRRFIWGQYQGQLRQAIAAFKYTVISLENSDR
ncbi:hypothetical protein [Roseofilum casamattae]|uniref:Double zinc ribbon domain-containing protein n=1 Tax=Roseofilum casamattae BLCC-M143 TaxID=3022442 RepID=A0ABT7C2S9_9CYAN|nr:hypothetical protein [Roseofilum casamattae]MDJ1185044.1 hypothetical protein [Roseofilum casamattae BLCC-M143]